MTVAELIAKLQTFPQDVPVFKSSGPGEKFDVLMQTVDAVYDDGSYAIETKGHAKPFVELVMATHR